MLTVMPFRVRDNDVAMLQGWTRSSLIRAGLAQRARIVLLSSEGLGTTAVADRIGVSRPTMILWRIRYSVLGHLQFRSLTIRMRRLPSPPSLSLPSPPLPPSWKAASTRWPTFPGRAGNKKPTSRPA